MTLQRIPPIFFSLICVCSLLLVVGCDDAGLSGQQSAAVTGQPILRVGVAATGHPYAYKGSGGQLAGLEIDFARKLAADHGMEVQLQRMNFDKLLPALQSGKVDIIMSGMTITAQRQSLARFTQPYMKSGQAIMLRTADLNTYVYPEIIYLLEKPIGVESGTIGDLLVQRKAPQATRLVFSSPQKGLAALKSGKIDAFVNDAPMVWNMAARNQAQGITAVPKLLTKEYLAWAVRRGDDDLLTKANSSLAKWRSDGTLNAMLTKYMPNYQVLQRMQPGL